MKALQLSGFVLLGTVLLPMYCITLLAALPYVFTKRATDWYVKQGINRKL